MAQSGIVTYDVTDMTDYQILFSAHYFKNMKSVPDVDWEKVAEPLSITPEFAKKYYEIIRKCIKLKEGRRARFAKKGLKDTYAFTPTFNPLALAPGEIDCGCEIPFCQGTVEELEADIAELAREVAQMKKTAAGATEATEAAEAEAGETDEEDEDDEADEATETDEVAKAEDKKEGDAEAVTVLVGQLKL